jgi:alkylation response protein AidB-like acyl-CoA dehydrogenase
MNFDFTDDQVSLRDAVTRWVDKAHGFERRHALAKAGGGTRAVMQELNDLGLMGLAVSDAHGGMGFGPVEAMVVMEALGRGIVSAPYAQAALIAPTVLSQGDADVQKQWLPRIADGSNLVVLAHVEHASRYRLHQAQTRAVPQGQGWQLTGLKHVVPAGDEADAFIVPAMISGNGGDTLALFLVKAEDAKVHAMPTQDGGRCADITLANSAATLITRDGLPVLEHAVDVGIAATCAEAVGLMERLLAVTVDYMNTRKQFGVAIASFQALRHRVADVKMQLELARSMSYYATLKLAEAPATRRRALSQAKVQLGQSMRFVGQQCVQLHGGIAVTDEYVASHLFKRLTMLELAFGDTLHHVGEVSARMQDTAGVFA